MPFVNMLDLAALGFDVEPEATGRPGYHPATMLKLYVYGYLNQVQSSRRLERECARNLELIWLMGSLKPDFKTIADFRRDNGLAIPKVCRQFVALCRDIDLLDAGLVAIDGSKFKAVNAKARSYTREKLRRRLDGIDAATDRYMGELDRADEVVAKTGMRPVEARLSRVIKKLAHYRKEARTLRAIEERMDGSGETQGSLTDPGRHADHAAAVQPPVPGGGGGGRHHEAWPDAAFSAPQLRDAPARVRGGYQKNPGGSRTRQARDDGAVHARRHRHDLGDREPVGSAVIAKSARWASRQTQAQIEEAIGQM